MEYLTFETVQELTVDPIEETSRARVEKLIAYLEAALKSKLRRRGIVLADAITDGRIDAVLVEAALLQAVQRVIRRDESGALNFERDGDYSYQIDKAFASGLVQITDDDLDLLGLPAPKGAARTIRVSPTPGWAPTC